MMRTFLYSSGGDDRKHRGAIDNDGHRIGVPRNVSVGFDQLLLRLAYQHRPEHCFDLLEKTGVIFVKRKAEQMSSIKTDCFGNRGYLGEWDFLVAFFDALHNW